MPNIQNEFNFKTSLEDGFNLFLGAGFSRLAVDKDNKPLPTDQELALELVEKFSLPPSLATDLAQVSTVLQASRGDDLRDYLTNRFTVKSFDEKYKILDNLPISTVFSVSIDDLLYRIFNDSQKSYLNNISITGPAFRDRRAIDLMPLLGSVVAGSGQYSFGPSAITSMVISDPDRWNVITERINRKSTLFWGLGNRDTTILQALRPNLNNLKAKDKWIILSANEAEAGIVALLEALNFQIVISELPEMLDYLFSFAQNLPRTETSQVSLTTKDLFPQEVIPELGSISVRPVLDFYRGAPPQWSDIYLGNLHRTSHFNEIKNSINSGLHTAIVGIPGCGKTTLLMQLAIEDFPRSYKLISESITPEKARLIINRLQGAKALIFVDNFTDSLEAFEYLSSQSNIQVIGADRDYNFGIVNHRIDRDRFNILNVTEISPIDIQKCFQALPTSIRRKTYSRPNTSARVEPSLFEVIQHNVTGSKLKGRFVSVLRRLAHQDPVLCELLVVICYISQARVPATLDLLIAYTRGITTDYDHLYELCDRLGSMISDNGGSFQLFDQEEDYFSPRSMILSEAVMENVSDKMLQSVLLRFVKNVSPSRVNRYDVFRRNAFDHRIVNRAFPNPEEGMAFYEDLYNRDDTPYLLQQNALYLSSKGRHTEAFRVIDRAVTTSGGRIWSIRNSHAIILFKANIDVHDKPNARESLRRSMQILTECYKWDKKRPFHALTFADQALKYWRVYGDNDARSYLETARVWLSDELERSSWNRSIKQLLPRIERALA